MTRQADRKETKELGIGECQDCEFGRLLSAAVRWLPYECRNPEAPDFGHILSRSHGCGWFK